MQRLREAAEKAKCELSSAAQVRTERMSMIVIFEHLILHLD